MCGWLSKKYKRFDLLSYIGCSTRRNFQLIWHRLYGYGYISILLLRNVCTNTYSIDMWSFNSFDKNIFLLNEIENNMFYHHGAGIVQNLTSRRRRHNLQKCLFFKSFLLFCAFHLIIWNVTVPLNISFAHTGLRIINQFFKHCLFEIVCFNLKTSYRLSIKKFFCTETTLWNQYEAMVCLRPSTHSLLMVCLNLW